MQYVEKGMGDGSPFPARERYEFAERATSICGQSVESVRHGVIWKDGDAESRGGEMGGCHDLASLHGPARCEAGGCTHLEYKFGEAVLGSEQNPRAIGEFFEDQGLAGSGQPNAIGKAFEELPAQLPFEGLDLLGE